MHVSDFAFEASRFYAWDTVALVTPFVYAASVVAGVLAMRTRAAWSLKTFSVLHSGFLSLLSLVMFVGIGYGALLKAWGPGGPWEMFCDANSEQRGALPFWIHIYWLSKVSGRV